jgi:hypothetical protein
MLWGFESSSPGDNGAERRVRMEPGDQRGDEAEWGGRD